MYCPRCGTQNDDNAWKCAQCGTELHATPSSVPFYPEQVTCSKAVWALIVAILGLLSLCCCCGFLTFPFGILAIVLGIAARNEIKANPGRLKGDALALAAIIIGIFDVVLGIVVPLVYFLFFASEHGLF